MAESFCPLRWRVPAGAGTIVKHVAQTLASTEMDMQPREPYYLPVAFSRRKFLQQAGGGLGALALAWLMHEEKARGANRLNGPLAPIRHTFRPGRKV